MKIIDMIKDKKVSFEYFTDSELWYSTECGFKFPVHIDEVGNATFKKEEKAIHLMRWIRKHKEFLEKEKENMWIEKLTTTTVCVSKGEARRLIEVFKHDYEQLEKYIKRNSFSTVSQVI
tara:strand:+ start:16678 stop:17034 length:357 start_codon:yes stop_codon:yes gene_type:complete